MSEIKKYKKYLNFKANPRYLSRDFIVPLYTGTEPDIVPEASFEQLETVQEFNEGGSVERQGYSFAGLVKETKNKLINESNSQKKFELKKRLNFLENLQKKSKNIQGAKSIENLILKKDKLGRPFFSDYLEKINALEDLQNNKYLNPKTNKPFTPKEWLDASPSYRSKFRDPETFLEKKKEYQKEYMRQRKESDPEYKQEFLKKKKEEYYSKERENINAKKEIEPGKGVLREQRNKLLSYMSEAAKDNPNYQDIIKNGRFVGVADKENGINYYEAGYKGKLGKNSKLITAHPDYNDINDLAKLADRFKRELPNKAIASYFSAYERVPTMSEMYNFLQADPRFIEKMSPKFFQTNALHLHHQISLAESPSQKIQLLLQDRNDQAGKKLIEFQKGNITKEKLNKDLKKLNTRYYVDGIPLGAIETSPETQLKTAKGQTTRLFNKRLQENPELIEQMTKRLGINKSQMIANIGCPTLVSKSIGGRVNFSEGSNCYVKGLEKIQSGELNQAERRIAGQFLKKAGADTKLVSGLIKGGKDALRLFQEFTIGTGPIGIGVTAALTAPFVLSDLAEGKRGSETLSNATFGLIGRDEEDILKGIGGPKVSQGLEIENKFKRLEELENQYDNLENQIMSSFSPDDITFGVQERMAPKMIESEKKRLDEEYNKTLDYLIPFLKKDRSELNPNAPGYKELLEARKLKSEEEKLRTEAGQARAYAFGIDDVVPQEKDGRINPMLEKSALLEKQLKEQEQKYYENQQDLKTILQPEVSPDDYLNEYRQYMSGGRVKLSEGGKGPKLSRRGFLGFLMGAASLPFVGKLMKGKKGIQAAKVATKVVPKVAGMPEWFPSLIARIEKEGIDISPKAQRVEDIVKVKKLEVPVAGEKKPDIITMREYPDGKIEIEADVYGGAFDTPFELQYTPPKTDINLETGQPVKYPGDFSVIESRPRPVVSADDADWEIDYENMNVKDAISDIERVEKIATGKRIHPKRVAEREKARTYVQDNPYDDIVNRYGDAGDTPDWWENE